MWKEAWNQFWRIIAVCTDSITKDAKSFFGAVMTVIVFVLICLVFYLGGWLKSSVKSENECKDKLLLRTDMYAKSIIDLGVAAQHAQMVAGSWKDTAYIWRDTANKYKYLYTEVKSSR